MEKGMHINMTVSIPLSEEGTVEEETSNEATEE
jgi:hypothetical protein